MQIKPVSVVKVEMRSQLNEGFGRELGGGRRCWERGKRECLEPLLKLKLKLLLLDCLELLLDCGRQLDSPSWRRRLRY